jgi:hypothetical protein
MQKKHQQSKDMPIIVEVSAKGVHGRYIIVPIDVEKGTIVVNTLQAINLNVVTGDEVSYKLVDEKSATLIKVRPRSPYTDQDIELIRQKVYEMQLVSEGHTLSYTDTLSVGSGTPSRTIKYLDIMYINSIGTHWVYMDPKQNINTYNIEVAAALT